MKKQFTTEAINLKNYPLNDNDSIVVQTGNGGVVSTPGLCGTGISGITATIVSAPCRIKVWKVGKVSA